MFNYILKQWKLKKRILLLIIIGFFVGSLFLSVGLSFSTENYNYIMDQNSGNPKEQLEINVRYSSRIRTSELIKAFSKMAEFGEVQIISLESVDIGDGMRCQFVPVFADNQGDWHIPLIKGKYLGYGKNKIVIGKTIAKEKNIDIGENVKLGKKIYNIAGISGRSNRDTAWDNTIYIKMSDFVDKYNHLLFDKKNDETIVFLVLKNGKDEFISNFSEIEKYCDNNGVSVKYEEMDKVIDDSSINNSLIITFLASGLIFIIAMINIMNLMIYWMLERRNQIGIMKALGATNKFVIKWIVFEMTLMSLIGAALALISQLIVSLLLGRLLSSNGIYIDISWINCFAAIGVSTFCGMISAVVLAVKTLKFTPIEVISCE